MQIPGTETPSTRASGMQGEIGQDPESVEVAHIPRSSESSTEGVHLSGYR